jgi:hypothetical protein
MNRIKLLFLVLSFTVFANATVYYVSPSGNGSSGLSWANAYTTIQPALAAATIGDEIWVAQGTYIIQNVETQLVIKGGVNVYGGFIGTESMKNARSTNPELTTISHQNSVVAEFRLLFSTDLNDAATWDGFTFDGKNVSTGVKLSGNCTLNNCIVKNCAVLNGSGAGVYMTSSSTFIPVTLSNTKLINNRLKVSSTNTFQLGGAGVYVKDGSKLAEIKNCQIKSNTIEGISATGTLEAMGAGIYIVEGKILNCTIDENIVMNSASATYSHNNFTAGAIAIVPMKTDVPAKEVLIEGCTITNNTSASRGGAIIIDPRWSGQYHGNYTISKTIISNCKSIYGVGGGILATAATVQTGSGWTLNVINSVISNNSSTSTNAGGGIFINIGCIFNVTNSTIVNNLAGNYAGGGIFMQGTTNHTIKATLKNVVLWGNQCTSVRPASDVQISSGGQASTIIFTAIQDYTPTATQFAAATLGDNMALVASNTDAAGPGFVAPSSAVGYGAADALTANWRLSSTSSLIDAGDNYITSDIVNTARPQGDYSDIGAYEYTTVSGLIDNKESLSTIRGTNGAIWFNNLDGVKQLNIYNIMGLLVKSVLTADGENIVRLTAKQVYIVKAGNTTTKVIVN